MSKILTVFGATGKQGGSVISAVQADPVLSKEFSIRAVTRDVNKPVAKELAAKGVEVVKADMSSQEAVSSAVNGAHSVYLMTDFWDSRSKETEISQGENVTNAAKAAGVKQLVFSSLINVTEASKGRLTKVVHFDAKASIESYIRKSGVPATFILPGQFMTNYLQLIRKQDDGAFILALPVNPDTAQIPLIDAAADTGAYVTAALKNFAALSGKRIYASEKYYTPSNIMSEFSKIIGKPATAVQIPNETFKSFLPPASAQEILETVLLVDGPGYYDGANLAESLSFLEKPPKTWKQFVQENKSHW